MPPLLDLPEDILHQILLLVPFHTLFTLRRTCTTLSSLVTDSIVSSTRSNLEAELLTAEMTLHETLSGQLSNRSFDMASIEARRVASNNLSNPDQLTCYTCLFSLPLNRFPKYQTRRKRTLGHRLAGGRFCAKCAVRTRRCGPGRVMIMSDDSEVISCPVCLTLTPYHGSADDCDGPCISIEHEGSLNGGNKPHTNNEFAKRCQKCWVTNHTLRRGLIWRADNHWCVSCYHDSFNSRR